MIIANRIARIIAIIVCSAAAGTWLQRALAGDTRAIWIVGVLLFAIFAVIANGAVYERLANRLSAKNRDH